MKEANMYMDPYMTVYENTQYGRVTFIYDSTNTGLTAVLVNGEPVELPTNVKNQTRTTILKKLSQFI